MKTEYVEKALFPWVHSNKEFTGIKDPKGNKIFLNDKVKYFDFSKNEDSIGTVSKLMVGGFMRYIIIDNDDRNFKNARKAYADIEERIIEKIN